MLAVPTVRDRSRALVEAGILLTSELSLEGVRQRLVEAAAELTGARYAALGVLDRSGQRLERFVTTGIDAETHAAIGDPPTGRGILGVLIRERAALRLHDLMDDPRAVGFPPHHPPMRSFLGVPVALRGVAFGNLYLTEKDGAGDFTQDDEDAVTLLASQAAVAIENARLYESARRWSTQLESLNEVANALVTEIDLQRLLQLVGDRLRELVDARLVVISIPQTSGRLLVEAISGEPSGLAPGTELADRSKSQRVLSRRHSERVDSLLEDPEVDQESVRRLGVMTAIYVPLVVRDRAIGVVAVHDKVGSDPR